MLLRLSRFVVRMLAITRLTDVSGRCCRTLGYSSCASESYDPGNSVMGIALLLLFAAPAFAEDDSRHFGTPTARSELSAVTYGRIRHQSSITRPCLRSRCLDLRHSRETALCIIRRKCEGARYGHSPLKASWCPRCQHHESVDLSRLD